MIAPVIRHAMVGVIGFTVGIVMKEAANREAEAVVNGVRNAIILTYITFIDIFL
jgi:hypothetical protein